MIFYVFYSNSSLLDSLENAVSEHLELLKFQTFSKSSTLKPTQGGWGGGWGGDGGLTAPLDPSAALHTPYGMYGAFKLKI